MGYLLLLGVLAVLVVVFVWGKHWHWGFKLLLMFLTVGMTIVASSQLQWSAQWATVIGCVEVVYMGIMCTLHKAGHSQIVGLILINLSVLVGLPAIDQLTGGFLSNLWKWLSDMVVIGIQWVAGLVPQPA